MSLPLQVAFLTGQSDPGTCALSPTQTAFLESLPVPAEARHPLNFPYDDQLAPWRPTPLWLGSLRHARLAIAIRRRAWAARHRDRVAATLSGAERTMVLAGSIGLDLLGRLDLPADVLDRLTVVAYGAVSTRPPRCHTVRVVSSDDLLARWWRADVVVTGGHLEYLAAPELRQLCCDLLAEMR